MEDQWFYMDVAVFSVVVVLAGFIIPQILLIAFRKNLFDEIDPRKIHKGAVPRLGGIAFFPSIAFAMLLIVGVCTHGVSTFLTSPVLLNVRTLCMCVCALIILYLVGIADDLIGIKYRAKFVAQIIAAVLIVLGGIHLDNIHGFIGVNTLQTVISIALTILLTVFITNAINLIDGIDGLASGLSAIACAFYGYIYFQAGLHIYAMASFATLGALVPFFYYNVFGNVSRHSKIFMGDTGALTIGIMLSILSIRMCSIESMPHDLNPAVAAFAPLLIPCLDVVRVYLHRIRAHRNPFLPDKTHIHHKLLALGMNQRVAMPTIVISSILLATSNYLLSGIINITLLFSFDIVVWIIANLILTRAIRRREKLTSSKLMD